MSLLTRRSSKRCTNVVSELRRPRPQGAVLAWLDGIAEVHLYISAVTVGEIQAGIEVTRERGGKKPLEIDAWLARVADSLNMIDMDARTFRIWAKLMHRKPDHLIEDADRRNSSGSQFDGRDATCP